MPEKNSLVKLSIRTWNGKMHNYFVQLATTHDYTCKASVEKLQASSRFRGRISQRSIIERSLLHGYFFYKNLSP